MWRRSPVLRAWMREALGRPRIRRRARPAPARPQAPLDSPTASRDSLRKLEALFEAGVLTAEQFAAERKRLLGD